MVVVRGGTSMRTLPRMALTSSAPSSNPSTPSRPLSSSPMPPPPAPLPSSPPFSSPSPLSATPTLSPPSSPLAPTPMPTEMTATPPLPMPLAALMPLPPPLMLAPGSTPPAPDLPFHAIAASGRVVLISLLARSCPDLAWASATIANGQMPVHVAAVARNLDAICLCVTFGGGDPDWADSHGWTPLHYASASRYLDITEFLIGQSAYNARLARMRDKWKMPFDLAIDGGHTKLYDALGLEEGRTSSYRSISVEEVVGEGDAGRVTMADGKEVGDGSGMDRWVGEGYISGKIWDGMRNNW